MKLILALLLVCALAAFGQQPAPAAPAAPKPPAVEPDDGTIEGRLYTSQYFGFRYRVPEGFAVIEDPAEGEEDASHRSFVLLSAYGDGQRRGSAIAIIADQLGQAGAADASTYLAKVTLPVMKRKGFAAENAVRRLTLAGHSFAALDFTRGEAAQTVVVTVLRGYALNFVVMAPTRTAAEQLAASLTSIEFPVAAKPRPAPAPAPAKP